MTVALNDAAIERFFHDPEGDIAKIIERKAFAVENAAKMLVLKPGSGGEYGPGVKFFRRGGKVYRWERGTSHKASAPGEPPASDTGRLLNSIGHTMYDGAQGRSARVSAKTKYALWLELGTRYMAPRPFMRPALDIGIKE